MLKLVGLVVLPDLGEETETEDEEAKADDPPPEFPDVFLGQGGLGLEAHFHPLATTSSWMACRLAQSST
jgi:hypothetical protein